METKAKSVKAKKEKPSESELVQKYAKRVIDNQRFHGRIDEKFGELKGEKAVNKNLWMDTDFYFSVVFQSSEQKYEFLEALKKIMMNDYSSKLEIESDQQVQIINGIKLAEAFGIELKKEKVTEYPTGNIDLKPFVLDSETL